MFELFNAQTHKESKSERKNEQKKESPRVKRSNEWTGLLWLPLFPLFIFLPFLEDEFDDM